MSYYNVLGVDKTATQDEIKKAYRKLSKQHHPDKTGGDDSKFKEINEAYETLGNEGKRQQYDSIRSGHNSNPFGAFHGEGSFGDMFDHIFGGQFRRGQQVKGNDYRIEIQITFNDAYFGISKELEFNGNKLRLNFKPGIKNGQRFNIKGKGAPHPFNSNLPNGDLIVTVHVLHNPNYIVQGNDIWIELKMPWWDAMLGCNIRVNTIEGPIVAEVPKNFINKVVRIKGKGYPIYNTGLSGDLMCKVIPTYPELNNEQLQLLNNIKQLNE